MFTQHETLLKKKRGAEPFLSRQYLKQPESVSSFKNHCFRLTFIQMLKHTTLFISCFKFDILTNYFHGLTVL